MDLAYAARQAVEKVAVAIGHEQAEESGALVEASWRGSQSCMLRPP